MFYNKTIEALQLYLVRRDLSGLNTAIASLEAERDNPSLVSTVLVLSNLTSAEIEQRITSEGSLKIRLADHALDGESDDIQEGKFLRVHASDQPEDTAMILHVTFRSAEILVLVPVMPL